MRAIYRFSEQSLYGSIVTKQMYKLFFHFYAAIYFCPLAVNPEPNGLIHQPKPTTAVRITRAAGPALHQFVARMAPFKDEHILVSNHQQQQKNIYETDSAMTFTSKLDGTSPTDSEI